MFSPLVEPPLADIDPVRSTTSWMSSGTSLHGEQAWARAKVSEQNKGGGAAEAALAMIKLRRHFGLSE